MYRLYTNLILERIFYFGLKFSILLIMIKDLGYPEASALEILSIFSLLVLLLPLFIVPVVDRYLTFWQAQIIGSISMILSSVCLLFNFSEICLILLAIGIGFFRISIVIDIIHLQYTKSNDNKELIINLTIVILIISIFTGLGAFISPLISEFIKNKIGYLAVKLTFLIISIVIFSLTLFNTKQRDKIHIHKFCLITGSIITVSCLIYYFAPYLSQYKNILDLGVALIITLYLLFIIGKQQLIQPTNKIILQMLVAAFVLFGLLPYYTELFSSAAAKVAEFELNYKFIYFINACLEMIGVFIAIPLCLAFKPITRKFPLHIITITILAILIIYLISGVLLLFDSLQIPALLFLFIAPGLDSLLFSALLAWILIKTPKQFWFGWATIYYLLYNITYKLYDNFISNINTENLLSEEINIIDSIYKQDMIMPWLISIGVLLICALILRNEKNV